MAHPDNLFYGHGEVLRAAAGIEDTERPLWGHLQHGWQLGTGLNDRRRLVPWLPKLVWNETNRLLATSDGIARVEAIGAPFLYLDRMHAVDEVPSAPTGVLPTIAYPFHGWERAGTTGSHDRLAHELRSNEGGSITVCLYWMEHDQPAIRRAYESVGHRVVCNGRREDPGFLLRQREELARNRRVVTNRPCSALWYGMWMGLEAEILGGPARLEGDRTGGLEAIHRRRWPDLFRGTVGATKGRGLAAAELGAAHIREPDDLAALLRLPPTWMRSRLRTKAVVAAVRVDHDARRLAANLRPQRSSSAERSARRLTAAPRCGLERTSVA
jgi:hypothetical protein